MIAGENVCSSPCDSSEYVFWDGECESTCVSLLSQGTFKSVQICETPCDDLEEFLYID